MDLTDLLPMLGVRIVTGPLLLRMVTDDDIPGLAGLAARGIHDPDRMPFFHPWTDGAADEVARSVAAYQWRVRADFSVAAWELLMGVWHEGELVGVQGFSTENYLVVRSGETGSWLGRDHQGRGIGTAMRQAMCAFVFDHLDAEEVTSGAFTDNPSSLAVSRKVGYRDNGVRRQQRRPGELALNRQLVLTPDRLVRGPHPLQVSGVAAFRRSIGLDGAAEGSAPDSSRSGRSGTISR